MPCDPASHEKSKIQNPKSKIVGPHTPEPFTIAQAAEWLGRPAAIVRRRSDEAALLGREWLSFAARRKGQRRLYTRADLRTLAYFSQLVTEGCSYEEARAQIRREGVPPFPGDIAEGLEMAMFGHI